MDTVYILVAVAVGLLLAEILLPTGGILAVIGALGLIASGVLVLDENSSASDVLGPGLIVAGIVCLITFVIIGRKVLEAHRDEPVRTGWEEMVGNTVEVRIPLDPEGQVFTDGALWKARSADGGEIAAGTRVRVESVDGLTLVVGSPQAPKED